MEFRILGPLEIADGDGVVRVEGPKQRAVLAVLLIHANEVVSTDRLIDALWRAQPPPSAANSLQSHVSRLRKLLARPGNGDEVLVGRPPGYLVRVEPDELDAEWFDRLVLEGRKALSSGAPGIAATRLREALALWRGPALAEFRYEEFAQAEIERLEELRLAALEDRLEADLRLGRHGEIVPELEQLVGEHPFRERLWGLLMLALYRSGRQAEALDAYRAARETLADELGIDPTPELRRLHERILQQDPTLDLTAAAEPAVGGPTVAGDATPAPRGAAETPTNLPAAVTRFVGRAEELERIADQLAQARLLTLVGPGGCGKTRLALEAGRRLLGEHPGGVFVASLSGLSDPGLVPEAVASALDLREAAGGVDDALADAISGRRMLLVLDNCEHVLEASAALVSTLLSRCPGLRVLATSRSPLGLPGEVRHRLLPLGIPDPAAALSVEDLSRYEAVRLFTDRAAAVSPGFELDVYNARAVAEICARLDGLPLALELAAARLEVLRPQQIAERLDGRFELLAGAGHVLPHHRTLRAALDWSYELLSPPARTLLHRLSTFRGGFGLEAADAVCAGPPLATETVLDALSELVDRSLVVAEPGDDEMRYRLLETVRSYARERLDDGGETARRHAAHFVRLAEEADARLDGPEREHAMRLLEVELDNLRAALRWAEAGDAATMLRGASALRRFWLRRGLLSEGRRWLAAALLAADASPDPPLAARAYHGAAVLAFSRGEHRDAARLRERSLALYREAGDAAGVASSLSFLAAMAWLDGEAERARTLHEEGLELFSRLEDRRAVASSLDVWSVLAAEEEHDRAVELSRESLELFRAQGDPWGTASSLGFLATVAAAHGDHAEAAAHLREGLELFERAGDRWGTARLLAQQGDVFLASGDRPQARERFAAALALFTELEDRRGVVRCEEALAAVGGPALGPVGPGGEIGDQPPSREASGET